MQRDEVSLGVVKLSTSLDCDHHQDPFWTTTTRGSCPCLWAR